MLCTNLALLLVIFTGLNNFCNFRDVLKFTKLKTREKKFSQNYMTGIC